MDNTLPFQVRCCQCGRTKIENTNPDEPHISHIWIEAFDLKMNEVSHGICPRCAEILYPGYVYH